MQISDLQLIHQRFEAEFWDAAKDQKGYTRHTLEHMAKLLGKMANVVEPHEHGLEPSTKIIEEQVIPDLLYYCLGLAAQYKVDPAEAFINRLEQNKVKMKGRRQGILEKPSV